LLKKITFFFICFFCALSSLSQAVEPQCDAQDQCWYASPTGSDNLCSYDQPCTIETATDRLSGGDILYLLPGVYDQHYANYDVQAIINFDKFFNFQNPQPSLSAPVIVKSLQPRQAVLRGDYSHQCVVIDRDYIQFDGLTIQRCWGAGVKVYNDINGNYIEVRNSLIEDIRGSDNMAGVYVGPTRGVVIENNEFRGNAPSTSTNGNCYSIILFQAADATIRNNNIHDACGGINFKHGEREAGIGGFTKILYNVLTNISGNPGIRINQNRTEIVDNLLIGTNISLHHEEGTQAQFTQGVKIMNNTIVEGGIVLNHGSADGSYQGLSDLGARNITVNRNVLYNSSYDIWRYGSNADFSAGIGFDSSHNCFYQSSGGQIISYFAAANFGDLGSDYTLSTIRDSLGFEQNSLEGNPQFVNHVAGNYRLSNESTCKVLQAGVRFGEITTESENESLCFPINAINQALAVVCL